MDEHGWGQGAVGAVLGVISSFLLQYSKIWWEKGRKDRHLEAQQKFDRISLQSDLEIRVSHEWQNLFTEMKVRLGEVEKRMAELHSEHHRCQEELAYQKAENKLNRLRFARLAETTGTDMAGIDDQEMIAPALE